MLYQSAPPETMRGLPIKQDSFMLVWIASSFRVPCLLPPAKGERHSQKRKQEIQQEMKP